MNALLFALLLSVAGPETSIPVHDLGDLALVPVRDGFVLAWSDGPRIYTEQLDANLQATNAPFSFPLVVPSSVTSLALASNGTSVLVTWQELRASNIEAQYAAILDSGAQSIVAGPLFMEMAAQPPVAGVKDGKYRVLVAAQVWTLDERLGIESVEVLPDGATTAFSATGEMGIANRTTSVKCASGGFGMPWQDCNYDEAITFTAPAGRSGFSFQWRTFWQNYQWLIRETDPLLRPPLIGPHGGGFVGAVVTSDGARVCEVRDGGRAWTTATPLLAIAGNGNDMLAIWRDSLGLRALFLGSEPFTLSDDGDVPKIVSAGSNSFVVLFRRGSSIVIRKVAVQAPRGRAVR
ncbi:MAG TPA: hypothetical protein VGR95_22595 [Thermoanaerobaculia bacterium]|nr:hypothetical protein [Thermoanaerobaculia bacterium]